jgi:hypothetical protein
MRNQALTLLGLAILGAGIVFMLRNGSRIPSEPSREPAARVPSGPPPALPEGFPPVFSGAELKDQRTAPVQGGWQRAFVYTAKAKSEEVIAFYRRALMSAGLLVMAEGGGAYGGMLRAQDQGKKRAVYVDVDAPEDKPAQTPRITVTVVDSE